MFARGKLYQEHTVSHDFSLEHTKLLFLKHKLLTVHSLPLLQTLIC